MPVDGLAKDVFGHPTGLYAITDAGKVLRLTGDAFEEAFDCGEDFGLQGIVGFSDGQTAYPALESDGSVEMVGGQNRKLVLVGATSAHVVDVGRRYY